MTDIFVPGLSQSQTLTRAAQKLSAARERLTAAEELQDQGEFVPLLDRYIDVAEAAEIAYKAAFKAYTNPFGVEKTYRTAPAPEVEEYTEEDVHVS